MTDTTIYNNPIESLTAYSAITGTFTAVQDLGADLIYRGFHVSSTLDTAIKIQFQNTAQSNPEISVRPGQNFAWDNFRHNGEIKIKYVSAPSSGDLQIISWRAE